MKSPYDVIIKPVITEASMDMLADKKYTFKVATDANKVEIKKAVVKLTADSKTIEFFESMV